MWDLPRSKITGWIASDIALGNSLFPVRAASMGSEVGCGPGTSIPVNMILNTIKWHLGELCSGAVRGDVWRNCSQRDHFERASVVGPSATMCFAQGMFTEGRHLEKSVLSLIRSILKLQSP